MFSRVLPIVLFGLLGAQTAMPQAAQDGIGGQQQYRLTGVMVSDTRRTALLNGHVVHEGSRIGGALIESIDQRQVRVRIGSEPRMIRVGQYFMGAPSKQPTHQYVVVTRSKPGSPEIVPARLASAPASTAPTSYKKYTVVEGDTLSAIALRHRPDGATMDQAMVALFDANPRAFDGNLNRLRAGAELKIPDSDAVQRFEAASASAQVHDHHERWRGEATGASVYVASTEPSEQPTRTSAPDDRRLPVQRGDTLSEIAQAISATKADISTAQIMVALYEANPDAFGTSMNTLYEGAVLRLPSDSHLADLSDAAASRVVQRQVAAWGHDPPSESSDQRHRMAATTASAANAAEDYLLLRWESPH